MSSFTLSDKNDRARSAAATAVVHLALGAAFLTGLALQPKRAADDTLKTFDVAPSPPPPPPVVEEQPNPAPAEQPASAGKKADPSPIVAPPARLPTPQPVAAAPVAGTGASSNAGAAASGSGIGAGGAGDGRGGGGSGGDGRGFTPAQRISKVPDRAYRQFVAASGMRRGRVSIAVKVNVDGRPSDCRVVRSSGNPGADGLMCQLTLEYVRFRPARDPHDQPVAQDIIWSPDWAPN